MALQSGNRLGPYEILASIGAGGMGEVYRARDTRLDRTVAIKVLPSQLAGDPALRERFDLEARAISSLNHPHICTLHDVGHQDGVDFLVMEYLEGETLAERLQKGPLRIEQALRTAVEIADALDRAHRHGLVHRDLKPSNIMLTKTGAKLLDFGLAKVGAATATRLPAAGLSMLATTPPNLTAQGTILGTFQYMAPEQLEAREADARSDIFAFGAVLYEMVTGRKAFEGQSQASLIAAILDSEPPPVSFLQPVAPASLDHVVQTCLGKDPDERWQTASDLKRELVWISKSGSQANVVSIRAVGPLRTSGIIAAISLAAIAVVAGAIWLRPARNATAPQPVYIPVSTPPGVSLVLAAGAIDQPGIAISPDGKRLVYAGSAQGRRLYLQDIDRPAVGVPIPGTEGAESPFFSTDGKWLAFVANNKLQKVAFSGGAPVALADVTGPQFRGGVWSLDDETIYFTPRVQGGIWRVAADGGKPVQIAAPDRKSYDDFGYWWPVSMLPGGQRLLFTSCCGRTRITVLDVVSGKRTPIIENAFFAHYVPTGYLVFAQGHTLLAARFDADSLKLGEPVKILDNFATSSEILAQYAISQTGTLVYFDGVSDFQRNLVRIDRNGAIRTIGKGARHYLSVGRFASDGRRLALTLAEGSGLGNIFVYDLLRDDLDLANADSQNNLFPIWTPDGSSLVFSSNRNGQLDLYVSPADKSRRDELLYASDHPKWAGSWSPDGKLLAFVEDRPGGAHDIWIYSADDRKARPFRNAPYDEDDPAFSPDGHWLAYASDELGHGEIYVVPYPGPGPTCKLSTAGGQDPRWSADGKELFYRRGNTAVVADVSNRNFCSANSRSLFDGLEADYWDVSPKGDSFITLEPREPPRLQLVLNWTEELKQRVSR
jgi:eukaryotic-like serine/threonine-protein kinase